MEMYIKTLISIALKRNRHCFKSRFVSRKSNAIKKFSLKLLFLFMGITAGSSSPESSELFQGQLRPQYSPAYQTYFENPLHASVVDDESNILSHSDDHFENEHHRSKIQKRPKTTRHLMFSNIEFSEHISLENITKVSNSQQQEINQNKHSGQHKHLRHGQKKQRAGLRLLNNHKQTQHTGLFPTLFNVASRAKITVNATCGQSGWEEYCKLVDAYPHKKWATQCGVCNDFSGDITKRRAIESVVSTNLSLENSWWQSPALLYGRQFEHVAITLDLKKDYQIFFIMLQAAISPRPASWILERSKDGVNFLPWQYFGVSNNDCRRRYGLAGQSGKYNFQNNTEVICTTQFSKALPLENGEIHVSLLKNRPGAAEQSPELMDFITARIIRIRFQGMHSTTNLDNSIDWILDAQSLMKRSFYSLKQIRVSARLDCNGHADHTMELQETTTKSETESVVSVRNIPQCICQHNTCGLSCGECCPLYNNRPFQRGTTVNSNECQKCQCNGLSESCIYDSLLKRGVCTDCRNNTAGFECQSCATGFFKLIDSAEEHCLACNCSMFGSNGDCQAVGGKCHCLEGFEGDRCEKCSPGYFGPKCRKCECDSRGLLNPSECSALCQCKANVAGDTCGECQPGFFDLNEISKHGCTPCWCSGVGLTCDSVQLEVTALETLHGWQIRDFLGSWRSEPTFDSDTNYLVYNMYDLDDETKTLFWEAPQNYLGNRLMSYGSRLFIETSWTAIRGDTSGRSTSGPFLMLWGTNGLRIAYFITDSYSHPTSVSINVTLDENFWYYIPDNETDIYKVPQQKELNDSAVSRESFLSILASLKLLLIRATYHTDQVETTLEHSVLYSGGDVLGGLPITRVEQCKCPTGYVGLSCESCDFGFIRVYEHDKNNIARCTPCPCNGHSNICDIERGICGNCSHNTYGERCERCKVGFYGNPLQGTSLDCRRCACPLLNEENNFSPSCQLKSYKISEETTNFGETEKFEYICTQCPLGYIGDHCEKCDENFFGDPKTKGLKCQPCKCDGGPCDVLTGACITCVGNTEGFHCERCKKGYWGDPLIGCEPCNCYDEGSNSKICNSTDGKCSCNARFSGLKCDQCELGFANIDFKCVPCDCDAYGSSNLYTCDPHSGQCECKPGVTGPKCNMCADGYFGLIENSKGCSECLCSAIGALSENCHKITGQCTCLPNVIGRRCETCSIGHWNLTEGIGCFDCLCDPRGTKTIKCDGLTGQCDCKIGFAGKRCNICAEGYFTSSTHGCRQCSECYGEGKVCDSASGRCICPPHSRGPGCSQCEAGYWGFQPRYGCQKCQCADMGTIGNICKSSSGQCQCREGFAGNQCNTCASGYFGYPECRRCNCDPNGTFIQKNGLISCDSNGQCPCKALVVGLKCDTCVKSTFGLSAHNPEGCTRCFCFGRSTECEQSKWSWGHIRMVETRCLKIEFIHSTNINRYEYEHVVAIKQSNSTTLREDSVISRDQNLGLIPRTTGNVSIGTFGLLSYPLYFQLPSQFLGDRTTSYGGYLYFTIITQVSQEPLDDNVLAEFPLVQLHAHSKLVLEFFEQRENEYLLNATYKIPLHESYWKHQSNGQVVHRATLMVALQNVKHIFIRGFAFAAFKEVLFQNVHMDSAINVETSPSTLAKEVEKCRCSKRYSGLSCQNPARGFYRLRNITQTQTTHIENMIGRAVPCQCNGRSNECDRENGVCQHCTKNTGGEHCERCGEGFYGDPNNSNGCQPCPCPEKHRNFAKGCTVWQSQLKCICKTGYAGRLCDICEPGHFSGRDLNENGTCFPCRCNIDGSISENCDARTGQCKCREGVFGLKCDKCIEDRYYLKEHHCQKCDNCSLILLSNMEQIKGNLPNGHQVVDLQNIPPPFLKVEEYERIFIVNRERFYKYVLATKWLNEYDKSKLLKIDSFAENKVLQWRRIISSVLKHQPDSVLNDISMVKSTITEIRQDILGTIFKLHEYKGTEHQINLPSVLQQAKFYLYGIQNQNDFINKLREKNVCAWKYLYHFGNVSDDTFDQNVHVDLFSRDLNHLNYQISDMRLQVDKAWEMQRQIEDILEHIYNLRNHVLSSNERMSEISDYHNQNSNFGLLEEFEKAEDNLTQMLQLLIGNGRLIQIQSYNLSSTLVNWDNIHREVRKHWLPKAKTHLARLRERSNEYARKFQPTTNIRIAVQASLVYKNISDSIKAAREDTAAASSLILTSQEVLYSPTRNKSIIQRADISLKNSIHLRDLTLKQLQKISDFKEKLKNHKTELENIRLTIYNAGSRSNNIISTFKTEVTAAKSNKLALASQDICSRISQDMRQEIKKINSFHRDIQKLSEKFSLLGNEWEIEIGMAEENISLTKTSIRLANITLFNMEQQTQSDEWNHYEWSQGIHSGLQNLRNKVTLARHASEGITFSLQSSSNPKCIRTYLPSHYGISTSNNMRLSFALSNTMGDSPLLYLEGTDNHFISLELRKRKVRFTWYLGGSTGGVTHPLEIQFRDAKYDDAWYHVEANRTLSTGSIIVRRMNNFGSLLPSIAVSGGSNLENTRFFQSKSERIYVGGYPKAMQKGSQISSGLNVVIHKCEVDTHAFGLWNFKTSKGKCSGAVSGAEEHSSSSIARYFNGNGYAKIEKTRLRPYRKNLFSFQMTFKTFDKDALLFHAVDHKNNRSVSVTLNDGRIMFRTDYSDDLILIINTTLQYNTGRWVKIEAAREFVPKRGTESGILRVDNDRLLTGSPSVPISNQHLPDLSKPVYYFGGVPPGFLCASNMSPGLYSSFLGCMRDIQINGESYDPMASSTTYGMEPSCKEAITRAGFNGEGFIEVQAQSLRRRSNVAFVFRTIQENCLLLLSVHNYNAAKKYDSKDVNGNFSITLINGHLNVWILSNRESMKMHSNISVNDGEFHAFNMIKDGRRFELFIDDELQDTKYVTTFLGAVRSPGSGGRLFIGGAPSLTEYTGLAASSKKLEGAIKDIVINNRTVFLNNPLSLYNVNMGRLGPSTGSAENARGFVDEELRFGKRLTATTRGCLRIGNHLYESKAYRFGDEPYSHALLNFSKRNFWLRNFMLSFDIRTFYANGIIFLSPGSKNKPKHFVCLVLKDGNLVLIVRGHRKEKMKLTTTLNDGKWHHVYIYNHEGTITMSVNVAESNQNLSAQIKIPKRIAAANIIMVGGVSPNMVGKVSPDIIFELERFKGCLRNFEIDNTTQDLAQSNKHMHVGQCYPEVERGAYFPGDAYAIYKRQFYVGKYLEIEMQLRTSELEGVLVSISEPPGFPAISLELNAGNVIYACDFGNGVPLRITFQLPFAHYLCDNQWHSVYALYNYEHISIRVDDLPKTMEAIKHVGHDKVRTNSPLYIGGLPGFAPSGSLLSRENFKGCIRNVVIRNESRDWVDMDSLQNVLMGECLISNLGS